MIRSEKNRAAQNTSAPPEALAHLARDEDMYVRWSVATHNITPPEVLVQLADCRYDGVRERVANNPNTPIEVLLILMVDDSSCVSKNAERALYARVSSCVY